MSLRYAHPTNHPSQNHCRNCYGPRGYWNWRRLRYQYIDHAQCWRDLGLSDQLMSEHGEWYTRSDPVPIDQRVIRSVQYAGRPQHYRARRP